MPAMGEEKLCEWCMAPLAPRDNPTRRSWWRRRYCDHTCRQRAYERRHTIPVGGSRQGKAKRYGRRPYRA